MDNYLTSSLVPLLPVMGIVDEIEGGGLFSAKALVQILCTPLAGGFIDIVGYKTPLQIGNALYIVSNLAFNAYDYLDPTTALHLIYLARALQGIASALCTSAGLVHLAEHTNRWTRGPAMGKAMAGLALGCLTGPSLSAFLYWLGGDSLHLPFFAMSLLTIFEAILVNRTPTGRSSSTSISSSHDASCICIRMHSDDSCCSNRERHFRHRDVDADSMTDLDVQSHGTPDYHVCHHSLPPSSNIKTDHDRKFTSETLKTHSTSQLGMLKKELDAADTLSVLSSSKLDVSHHHLSLSRNSDASQSTTAPLNYLELLRNPSVFLSCLVLMVVNASVGYLEPSLPVYWKTEVGLTSSALMIGFLFSFSTIAYLFASPIVGHYMNGPERMRKLTIVGGLFLMTIAVPLVSIPSSVYTVGLPLILVGIACSMADNAAMAHLADIAENANGRQIWGNIFALADCSVSIGFLVGPIAGGVIAHYTGFQNALCVFSFANILVIPLLHVVWPRSHSNSISFA